MKSDCVIFVLWTLIYFNAFVYKERKSNRVMAHENNEGQGHSANTDIPLVCFERIRYVWK